MPEERKRIAIIGSGISGISALWTLRNTGHEIHLFEKDRRLGGHTNTVTWTHNGHSTPVDTGFIVLNTATYPNFIQFLQALNVTTIQSQMTFGISRDAGLFEWSGTSGSALFAQIENALKPSFWRMIFDIVRFNQFALDLLSIPPSSSAARAANEMSIGKYLEVHGYSAAFRDDYLIPMTACVWSTGADKCALEFPALTLIRFMWNHHLLSTLSERPPWLTIKGGAKTYIDAVLEQCPEAKIRVNTPVKNVVTHHKTHYLSLGGDDEGKQEQFEQVILACHGDEARGLLGENATLDERQILDAFETTLNKAYLHSDLNLMPKRKAAWSAWNYLTTSQSKSVVNNNDKSSLSLQTVSLTYDMNTLQSLPAETFSNILVTLNPEGPPEASLTKATYEYRHPLYNARMIAAQEKLETIQGKRGIWFAGAWTGYGFHEDGFSSGMRIGLRLGGDVPWKPKDAKFSRGLQPIFTWKDWIARAIISFIQLCLLATERLSVCARRIVYEMKGTVKRD